MWQLMVLQVSCEILGMKFLLGGENYNTHILMHCSCIMYSCHIESSSGICQRMGMSKLVERDLIIKTIRSKLSQLESYRP